tara:strand:- start:436 stop:636 length:201 start_codon:yes stop_codon:yes gene_type:complete
LINSRAEEGLLYFDESFSMASLTEFISELVISDNDLLETGLPLRYKTASIFVTSSGLGFIFFSEIG